MLLLTHASILCYNHLQGEPQQAQTCLAGAPGPQLPGLTLLLINSRTLSLLSHATLLTYVCKEHLNKLRAVCQAHQVLNFQVPRLCCLMHLHYVTLVRSRAYQKLSARHAAALLN